MRQLIEFESCLAEMLLLKKRNCRAMYRRGSAAGIVPGERLLVGRVGVVMGELEASIVALPIAKRGIIIEGVARRIRSRRHKKENQKNAPHPTTERFSAAKSKTRLFRFDG